MLILANVLLLVAALATLMLVFSSSGWGPEGPVGAHMVTAPLALLQVVALGITIGRGDWEFVPVHAVLLWLLLAGYLVTMTILPIAACEGSRARVARLAVVAALAGCVAAVDGAALMDGARGVQAAGGVIVALVALGGWCVLGALFIGAQRNALRRAQEDVRHQTEFEQQRAAFEAGEFAKLPADAEPWQLIQYTHSFDQDVQRRCLERLNARPGLAGEMAALLGTGWAKHALPYLRDFYPLPHQSLAAAYAPFLDAERESWQKQLAHDANPGGWQYNLSDYFEVADRIARSGGDVRPQLQRWHAFLGRTRGLGGVAARVQAILERPIGVP